LWQGGDPIGEQLVIGKGLGPNFAEGPRRIVGIVGDVLDNGLGEPSQPSVYVPAAQLPDARTTGKSVSWVISTRTQSNALGTSISRELQQATGEPVSPALAMDEVKDKSTAPQELNMILMSIFGGSALLLASIGIYGLLAYTVQQRTQEIGIRMALGARANDVRNMVLSQGMRLTCVGIAIGIIAAIGLTRFLAGFLFGVKALDPFAFVLVPLMLALIALIAIWVPAERASRVDPTTALRHE
jgi:ABC-type antimicrobial peptide transport system permease subunit